MQITQKLIYIVLALTIVMTASTTLAKSYRFEMYANADDVYLGVESETPLAEAMLNVGGGAIFSREDYRIGNLHFALKDEVFIPALTLGLGLKGVLGRAENDSEEYDLAGVGFMVLGEYDFRKVYYNFPIVLQGDVTSAPKPMTAADADSYNELNLRIKGYLVKSAALVLGYKNINVRLDKDSDDYKLSDDMIYFGIEFSF
jgi:YfaZ precursor